MRIAIPTTGSRGDVQPYVALGKGLQAEGHRVCLATHANFEPFVRLHGLDFFPLEADAASLQGSDTGDRMLRAGNNPFKFLVEFARLRRPLVASMMRSCLHACDGADLIFLTNTEFLIGHAVAQKLGLPTVWTALQPVAPSLFLVNSLFPQMAWWVPGSRLYNLTTHLITSEMLWQLTRTAINEARREVLGLPGHWFLGPLLTYFFPPLCLDGYSAHVVPRPLDWGRHRHVTGFWFLEAARGWHPPTRLRDFLESGPPPVYIGFGSMHNRDADRVTEIIVEALARAGQRGVVYTGWNGLRAVAGSDRLFALESETPHDWLFPRMAAVVHHGGAGTTGAALRAGVPAVVVPFMSDQPFWARRVHELGAGPAPVPRARLTAQRLGDAILRAVTESTHRQRAAELGRALRAEDGVMLAVRLVEQHVRTLKGKPVSVPVEVRRSA
jgi:UDP:flavonoid glycosyltransferase YjiC (YdhE family)